MAFVNLVKVTTATTGTGTMTLSSAVTGFLTMSQAGAVNGATYSYGIVDGTNSEVGRGVWSSGTNTLTRNVINSTNSNALISLSGTAKVYITGLAEDFDPVPLGDTPATLYTTTSPTTPTEGVVVYAMKRANRRMVGWKTPTGRTERFGPWLGANNRYEHSANQNSTSYTSMGCTLTAVGTASAQSYTATNFLSMQKRNQQSIATAAGMLEQWGQAMCSRNPGSGGGGFHMALRFGLTSFNSDAKLFCGITNTAAAWTNVNPSTRTNFVGLAKDSGDTSLTLMANGGSGTAQKISLPNTGSMTGILNTFWQVEIFCKAGDSQFGYRITRTSSAGVESIDEGLTTGTQNAAGGIPTDAAVFGPRLWTANTSAVTLTMQFSQFFMETD